MSDTVIRVENLGKKYIIGHQQREHYVALRDVIAKGTKSLRRQLLKPFGKRIPNPATEEFWALKDVSFEVNRGDRIGIIGRNGAGKSTLLKILSRITEPTKGRISIKGRVASLLEVGTGFHPELTGRENIYLNGAILGMSRFEIKKKFDEIVAFAEVEKFLDTPVKFYSSGMYVRLAFAVAAHLEPEILIVDEVLAVGDAQFQKKCLGKMEDVAEKEGRTVLFVSHNMTTVQVLCQKAVLLERGKVKITGSPKTVIGQYLSGDFESLAERVWSSPKYAPGCQSLRLHRVSIRDRTGITTPDIDIQHPFSIEVEYWVLQPGIRAGATILIWNQEGTLILSSLSNHEPNWHGKTRPQGLFKSVCQFPENFLNNGRHSISVLLWKDNYVASAQEDELLHFEVHESSGGVRGDYFSGDNDWGGAVRVLLDWKTEYLREDK
jgi:lipopolysaccharide transport system ATP-binding protein